MLALKIENLKKTYPTGTEALKGLSFEVQQGEFFALLGPNGSGKTTMISIMSGPTLKTSGKVEIAGMDIDTHREETKMILGVVPQEISSDHFFTVNEVLKIESGYYGLRNNQKKIDEVLEKLNLQDKKHFSSRTLSGGMKRRLLIAKALVHDPEILVLDEPTAGVDIELRHGLWNYIRQLNEEGLTILLTTHYLEEAETLCNRTAIIHKGELVALDKTKTLIRSMGNQKVLTLSFHDPVKKIPKELAKYKAEKISDYDLNLTFEAKQIYDVFRLLDKLGIQANDIDLNGQDLEDVFIKLTGGK